MLVKIELTEAGDDVSGAPLNFEGRFLRAGIPAIRKAKLQNPGLSENQSIIVCLQAGEESIFPSLQTRSHGCEAFHRWTIVRHL